MTELVEEQRATCRNCGHAIVWYFDRDENAEVVRPHGFWYDAETMIESCGGADPDVAIDDNLWHEPDDTV